MSEENPRAVMGDNHPPITATLREQLPILIDSLIWDYADLDAALSKALDGARKLPHEITSEAIVADYAAVVKDLKSVEKRIEADRKKEKQPYIDGGAIVDGHFKGLAGKIEKTMVIFNKRTKAWQDMEAARKRREAEEAQRLAREQERQRLEEAARLEAVARKQREEEAAARAAEIANNTPRDFSQAPASSASLQTANEAATHIDHANLAAHDARVAGKAVAAKPAEHVRARSDSGAVSTTAQFWTSSILDMDMIPPSALWPFISAEAKEKAVNAFVKAGGRELPGVRIYEDTKPVWR